MEFDIKLDKKTLNRFLLRNNFLRVGGVCGLLISLAAIVGLIVFWGSFGTAQRVILVFLALMFPVIQPFSLLLKGWEQLRTGTFKDPFHYVFSEEGMQVQNTAGSVDVKWGDIRRAIVTKEAIYIYMNALSAFIIPRGECGDKYVELAELIKEHVR